MIAIKAQFKILEAQEAFNKKTAHSAGFDLLNAGDPVWIRPGEVVLVPTGVHLAIPDTHYGSLSLRSSSAILGLLMPNAPGIIDPDYRGEIKIPLTTTNDAVHITHGRRIAQIVFLPKVNPEIILASTLDNTNRGQGGFGSTGK